MNISVSYSLRWYCPGTVCHFSWTKCLDRNHHYRGENFCSPRKKYHCDIIRCFCWSQSLPSFRGTVLSTTALVRSWSTSKFNEWVSGQLPWVARNLCCSVPGISRARCNWTSSSSSSSFACTSSSSNFIFKCTSWLSNLIPSLPSARGWENCPLFGHWLSPTQVLGEHAGWDWCGGKGELWLHHLIQLQQ